MHRCVRRHCPSNLCHSGRGQTILTRCYGEINFKTDRLSEGTEFCDDICFFHAKQDSPYSFLRQEKFNTSIPIELLKRLSYDASSMTPKSLASI